jgi:hypothetical protein
MNIDKITEAMGELQAAVNDNCTSRILYWSGALTTASAEYSAYWLRWQAHDQRDRQQRQT